MSGIHWILGEKVSLYRRSQSEVWHCATSISGNRFRKSTKVESLALAKDLAEDWKFDHLDKNWRGEILSEKTFRARPKIKLSDFSGL